MSDEKKDAIAVRELPEPVARRGITEPVWLTLANNLYPGANPKSVLMVWDYCAARKLDPLKKPVHIVPMKVKNAASGEYEWRDVVMPGVYEHRITAQRTGEYLGHSKPEYGQSIQYLGVTAPEWCEMTMYRWNRLAGQRVEFPVKVYFREVVATTKDRKSGDIEINDRWTRAPIQMLTKCTEAAGTREAFPEEIGGEPTAEEMDGQHAIVDVTAQPVAPPAPWEALPEAFRDTIERAFTALGFTVAQRLAKMNEHFGRDGVAVEDAAQQLLDWCRDEFSKLKTGQPRKKVENGNAKAPAGASAPPAVDPRRSESDARGAGPELPAGGSGQVALPTQPISTPKIAEELFAPLF